MYLLAEAEKYAQNQLLAGVVETIIKDSPALELLPFVEVVGNNLKFLRESALPDIAWYAPNDTWGEDTQDATEVTVDLKILGGDADVDAYLQRTRSNPNDLRAEAIASKAKALAHAWQDVFIYGSETADSKKFDGLHRIITADLTGQQVHMGSGSTGAAGTLTKLDEMIDLIRPGKPDFLMMSRQSRRNISTLRRSQGPTLDTIVTNFGTRVSAYDGIPIFVNDFQSNAETISSAAFSAQTGGATTSVFAVKVGDGALVGLEAGGITHEDIGKLETRDATRDRIKWYTAIAALGTTCIARLDGITNAAFTN